MSVTPIRMDVGERTPPAVNGAYTTTPGISWQNDAKFIDATNSKTLLAFGGNASCMPFIVQLFMQAPGGGSAGTVSTAKLIAQLRSTDFSLRRKAAVALGKRRAKNAVIQLTQAVAREKIWSVKAAMVTALGDIGDKRASATIKKALKDKHWWVGAKAVEAAVKLKDYTAVPLLIELLRSNNITVFKAARDALHAIKHRKAVAPLVKALGDPNEYVRGVASAVLGTQGDKRAVPALMVIAAKDPKPYVTENAVKALGELGDPRAFATIVAVLNRNLQGTAKRGDGRGTYTYRATDPNVAAAKILGKMKSEKAITALIMCVKNANDHYLIREAALTALGKTGSPRAKPTLMRVLARGQAEDYIVQRAAAKALKQFIADPKVKAVLRKGGWYK